MAYQRVLNEIHLRPWASPIRRNSMLQQQQLYSSSNEDYRSLTGELFFAFFFFNVIFNATTFFQSVIGFLGTVRQEFHNE